MGWGGVGRVLGLVRYSTVFFNASGAGGVDCTGLHRFCRLEKNVCPIPGLILCTYCTLVYCTVLYNTTDNNIYSIYSFLQNPIILDNPHRYCIDQSRYRSTLQYCKVSHFTVHLEHVHNQRSVPLLTIQSKKYRQTSLQNKTSLPSPFHPFHPVPSTPPSPTGQ